MFQYYRTILLYDMYNMKKVIFGHLYPTWTQVSQHAKAKQMKDAGIILFVWAACSLFHEGSFSGYQSAALHILDDRLFTADVTFSGVHAQEL